jgi:DNA-binding Lrp family transcriptional regulator
MKVQVDALQARIVSILKDWYPITVEELRDELSLPSGVLERSLKSLMVKGVIELEPLTDKTYIRLLVPEIVFEVDKKDRGRKKRPSLREAPSEDDSIMYR